MMSLYTVSSLMLIQVLMMGGACVPCTHVISNGLSGSPAMA